MSDGPAMPKRRLGRHGPDVSLHALGAMTFGYETDEPTAHRMLDLFVERGGTLIDTADVYSDGASEAMIGRWIEARGGADELVVATKCRFAPEPGSRGGSRRTVLRAAAKSLDRLKVDAIDLYFVHGWDPETDVTETLEALADLVRTGRVHHVAWSNVTGWQLERIVRTAEAKGLPMPCALQPQYNLLDRGIELEAMPCAIENGVGLTPWSPLGGGWLTGKYSADERPTGATRLGTDPNRGVEAYDLRNTERTHAILRTLAGIAERHGRPQAHVALGWLASRPGVGSILLGARTVEQLESNLDAVDLDLSTDDLDALTRASAPGLPAYPYGMVREFCGVEHWDRLGTRVT